MRVVEFWGLTFRLILVRSRAIRAEPFPTFPCLSGRWVAFFNFPGNRTYSGALQTFARVRIGEVTQK
jgi:hypothetical protein